MAARVRATALALSLGLLAALSAVSSHALTPSEGRGPADQVQQEQQRPAAAPPTVLRVPLGQDVVVPCLAPVNASVSGVEWRRSGLGSEYVLSFRDGRPDAENQSSSYENRVQLADSELERGDLSLTLRNVSSGDYGTYECWMMARVNENTETSPELVSTSHLTEPAAGGVRTRHPPGELPKVVCVIFLSCLSVVCGVLWYFACKSYIKDFQQQPVQRPLQQRGPITDSLNFPF